MADGTVMFTPQKRIFGFWIDMKVNLQGGCTATVNKKTECEAVDYVRNHFAYEDSVTTVKTEIL